MSARMSAKPRRAGLLGLLVAIAAIALAACGGGGGDSGTTAEPSGTTGETSAPEEAASGEPIKVLVTSFVDSPAGSVPEIFAGAEVAAENINKEGGVNGHPLEVVTCNEKADPKADVACARKGVEEGVIAGDSNVFLANPEGALEVLNRAGISDVAGAGGQPVNFSLPNVYPIDDSAGAQVGCISEEAMSRAGDSAKLAIFLTQNPFSEGVLEVLEPAIESNPSVKSRFVGTFSTPETTQDFGPLVQQISDAGAEYVIPDSPPAGAASFVTAAGTAGKKWVFCADGGLLGPELLEQIGPLTKEVITTVGYPPTSVASEVPMVQQFVDEMTAAEEAGNKDASLAINPVNAMRPWFGMHAIAQVAETIEGEINAETFAEAISTAEVDLGYTKINFAEPQGEAPYERVFQPVSYLSAWNNETKELEKIGEVNLLEVAAGK